MAHVEVEEGEHLHEQHQPHTRWRSPRAGPSSREHSPYSRQGTASALHRGGVADEVRRQQEEAEPQGEGDA